MQSELGEEVVNTIKETFGDNHDFNETRPKEFRDAFSKAVNDCLAGQSQRRGFMFFIDDLDRINPENAIQILELLKNMFEVDNCIFVLAIDYDVIVKGLKAKFGNNSGNDDRAFRSFFDKIIQMPFSMPIGAYDTTAFLKDSLNNIGYLSTSRLEKEITLFTPEGTKLKVLDIVDEMTRLSTGTNPRSIKRLLNTLSLIKIISNIGKTDQNEEMDEYDHLMNYGLVCLQIAYPQIYDRITQEPYFPDWDENTARQFRLKPLPKEKLELLDKQEGFNEPWEQVVYQICQTSTYLMASALNISELLNLIKSLYEEEILAGKINTMLGMTSVTSVTQSENQKLQKSGAKMLRNRNDLITGWNFKNTHSEKVRILTLPKNSRRENLRLISGWISVSDSEPAILPFLKLSNVTNWMWNCTSMTEKLCSLNFLNIRRKLKPGPT